jgi:uncharacterized integral membrane protein (TIGR00697 family)
MLKIKRLSIFETTKNISNLQVTLMVLLVLNLILSNILVIKQISFLGLANTAAILTFPMTYILSDVLSEVYGYKASRLAANWAIFGTGLASLYFAATIAIPGSEVWANQEALVTVLGNAPIIAIASMLAFWLGDLVNDRVFRYLKNKNSSEKLFFVRALGSSLAGKYTDAIVFTFVGLHFLPMNIKLVIVATAPFVQMLTEAAVFPITQLVAKKVKKAEGIVDRVDKKVKA